MSFHHNKHVYTLVPMYGFSGLLITYHVTVQTLYVIAVQAESVKYTYTGTSGVFHVHLCKHAHMYMCVHTCTSAYIHICVSLIDAASSLMLTQ